MTTQLTASEEQVTELRRAWYRARTFTGWLTDVQHRSIGARYVATGLVFFVLAGIAALLMRIQLARPEMELIDAELYNQLFTMHGATMMFLFAVPIMQGLGIFIVPMMIGARDMAYPRLNAFGYWLYLAAGTTLWISLFFRSAPNSGWFNYPPLGTARYEPGVNIDVYALAISLVEIAAIVAALELVVTVLRLRTPGMTLGRLPLFVWSQLVMSAMVLIAFPAVLLATALLELDNLIGTHFYVSGGGGDPLLWQHLFWFFGHPEVYIILLPGLGIVAGIVATFTGREIVGYRYVVAALVAIGVLSFAVWVHHMFATGRAGVGMGLFSVATFAIVIPSGVQIFATLATLAYGRLRLTVPMLYALGFIVVFVLGGLTGINVASIPVNLQVHDTYFVVAHFHYVLLGGALFPLLAGLTYWYPKFTGRMLDERSGRASFWLIFIGMNVTFFPMHLLGLWGMPRRIYTYLTGLGWDRLNAVATLGALVMAAGIALLIINAAVSARRGAPAPVDPWGAGTLEWSIPSPPPDYGFIEQPLVESSQPLWQPAQPPDPELAAHMATSFDRRETIATTMIDGRPTFRAIQRTPTIIPLFAAIAVAGTFLGVMIDPVIFLGGLVAVIVAFIAWHRPDPQEWDRAWLVAGPKGSLPTSYAATSSGVRGMAWSGGAMTVLLSTVLFGAFLASYLYLLAGHERWPLGNVDARSPTGPLIASLPLLASVVPLVAARRAVARDQPRSAATALFVAAALALVFAALKVIEFSQLDHDPTTNVSTSLDWTLTGFHLLFVLASVVATITVGVYCRRGLLHANRSEDVVAVSMFGSFVAMIWIPVFIVLYLSHLLI